MDFAKGSVGSRKRRWLVRPALRTTALPVLCAASPKERAKDNAPRPDKGPRRPAKRRQASAKKVWKVYVSGFHDWPATKDEAIGFNWWRCMRNPSGYLFIGEWYKGRSKPDPTRGLLPKRLKTITTTNDGCTIEWTFDTLPVEWNTITTVGLTQYDVVVNLGYGVYHSASKVRLENGAWNGRAEQADAAAKVPGKRRGPPKVIDPTAGKRLAAPKGTRDTIKATAGDFRVGTQTYTAEVANARQTNGYVCNETHYLALQKVKATPGRPHRAVFIHIPKPAKDRGYPPLAALLARIIEKLIQP